MTENGNYVTRLKIVLENDLTKTDFGFKWLTVQTKCYGSENVQGLRGLKSDPAGKKIGGSDGS